MSDFSEFDKELQRLKTLERFRTLESRRTDGIYLITENHQRLCNFGSNDYLGYATQDSLKFHQGSAASPLVCGWSEIHEDLSLELARFESAEAVCLFSSGYAASSGAVATLARERDVIFSDELNHASLIDGCRLSRAKCFVYSHRDIASLRLLMSKHREHYQNAWIVTDSVFSMDGHLAPLTELCDLRDEFGAAIIIDEAHATGVFGEGGSGLAEWLNVKKRVDVIIGTLSKAIGSQGGFIASTRTIIDYLTNRCRSLIYSTALPQSSVAAAAQSVHKIMQSSRERDRVTSLAEMLRESLAIKTSSKEMLVPIIPVVVGSDGAAIAAAQQLRQAGFYVPAIRPPTVPEGQARLRISLSALHTEEMIVDLLDHLRPLVR